MTEIERRLARQEQDRLFRRNKMLQQKLVGIIICMVAVIAWWVLSDKYGQFEWGIMAGVFVWLGLYLILTKKNVREE